MDDAYPDFFSKKFEFNKKYFGGPNKRPNRQERCTMAVMRSFNKEVDFILLPKTFPNFPKEKFIKSIEKIRSALLQQLNENTWLGASTKQEAIRKIKNANLLLVSPNNEKEWNFNPRATYATNTPIANSHKLAKLLMDKALRDLSGPININRWQVGPLTVNAYYNPSYNQILFPVGILQYPFYDPNEPEEVNLGAIGSVIGHELGHAIDNHGGGFNADGVLKQWILPKDKKIFNEKTKHLITQFNKIGHSGEFTLRENIGDLVGLSAAYKAAFPDSSNNNQELKKRFFLQLARLRCETQREEFAKLRLKTDPHPLGYARANEQIKHQIGFKEAYSCKPNDPMVIPEKEIVKVW
jgi:putative endopeptidase